MVTGGGQPLEVRLSPLGIARASATLYRRHWPRVSVLAVVLLVPVALVGDLPGVIAESPGGRSPSVLQVIGAGATVLTLFLTLLAEILFAGLLDYSIGSELDGVPAPSVAAALRGIPYGRLVLVQLLAMAVIIAGLVLLVVPGLVALTLLCIAGPVAALETVGPLGALRRSARLVVPYWWLAAMLVFLPELGAGLVDAAVEVVTHDHATGRLVASVLVALTISAFEGVTIAVFAHALVSRARGRRR
jgi:hypothetical protein